MTVKSMNPDALWDSLILATGYKEITPFLQPNPKATRGDVIPGFRLPPKGARWQFLRFFDKDESAETTETGHGIPQFLCLMNPHQFNKKSPYLEKVVAEQKTPEKIIETLFLSTLARRPTSD